MKMEHIFAAALLVFLRVFVSSDSNIQGETNYLLSTNVWMRSGINVYWRSLTCMHARARVLPISMSVWICMIYIRVCIRYIWTDVKLDLFRSSIAGAFVVVPRSVQNPVNHTAQFNCTIAQGQLQWLVRFKDYSYDFFWPSALYDRTLLSRGVNVVNTTERASILFINATQQNNGTQVQCIAAMQTFLNRTEKANLTVFGKSSMHTCTQWNMATWRAYPRVS